MNFLLLKTCKTYFYKGCQHLFYVALYLILTFQIAPYDSTLIENAKDRETIKTYYPHHLRNLGKAVKPRIVSYVDAQNYNSYGKLLVTGALFTYANKRAARVYFVSDLDGFKKHRMLKNAKGVWYYILVPPEYTEETYNKKIRYKFQADSLYTYDKTHDNYEEDFANSFISVYYFRDENLSAKLGVIKLPSSNRYGRKVLFRIKNTSASEISIVGSFNNWNAKMDKFENKGNGLFELRKILPPGKYIYQYNIDGVRQPDKNNFQLKHHKAYGKVSYLELSK